MLIHPVVSSMYWKVNFYIRAQNARLPYVKALKYGSKIPDFRMYKIVPHCSNLLFLSLGGRKLFWKELEPFIFAKRPENIRHSATYGGLLQMRPIL